MKVRLPCLYCAISSSSSLVSVQTTLAVVLGKIFLVSHSWNVVSGDGAFSVNDYHYSMTNVLAISPCQSAVDHSFSDLQFYLLASFSASVQHFVVSKCDELVLPAAQL